MATLDIGDNVKAAMLNGIEVNATEIQIIDDAGNIHDTVALDSTDWDFQFETSGPIMRLQSSKTLNVTTGTIIEEARLKVDYAYPTGGSKTVNEEVGGTGGESFPDGGSITITAWEFTLSG